MTVGALLPAGHRASTGDDEGDSVIAVFEGREFRLADGWGAATACVSDDVRARCYRSEQEMDEAEAALRRSGAVAESPCGSSLRLYRSTSYRGDVLSLARRGIFIDMSAYGFDNDTSSYAVGGCSATFYDGASGGQPTYPGSTSAGAASSSMASGWDNRVSSVFIS